jgi:integrase
MNVLTSEQVERLLDVARGDRFEALFYLAVTTGMRRGELLGLKWEDVNLDRGTIQVRRSVSVVRGGLIFVPPKSAKGKRNIALTSRVVKVLKEHQVVQDKERLRADWQENGLIFPTIVGTPMYPHRLVQRYFKKLLRKADLPNVRFHDLRHTCATLLLTKGVHPKIVQEMLGHSSIIITLDTYSHVLPNMQSEAVRAMDSFFEEENPEHHPE